MNRIVNITLATLMIVLWAGGRAIAGTPIATPEIDAPTISAGIGLVAAGVLLVKSKRPR